MSLGKDISCAGALRTGRYVTGARLVAEAAYRRLTTPRGALRGGEDEANYGIDLTDGIGQVSPRLYAASLPGKIRNELLKDERIESVTTTVAQTSDGVATSFAVTIEAQTSEGPFTLGIAIDEVTTEILGIATEAA